MSHTSMFMKHHFTCCFCAFIKLKLCHCLICCSYRPKLNTLGFSLHDLILGEQTIIDQKGCVAVCPATFYSSQSNTKHDQHISENCQYCMYISMCVCIFKDLSVSLSGSCVCIRAIQKTQANNNTLNIHVNIKHSQMR